jgi:N-acyl-D-amino-acid deacylase
LDENTYGGFAKYLRRCVRNTAILTLEEAISKVTSTSANKFRLTDRSIRRVGAYADIDCIQPRYSYRPKRNNTFPSLPDEIKHVFVNGKQVIKNRKHTGVTPGKILRR